MPELRRKPALAHRNAGAPVRVGGATLRERHDLRITWLTSREPVDVPGAIRLGPDEWLTVEEGEEVRVRMAAAAEGGTALVQDMDGGLTVIEAEGPDLLGAIGLSSLTPDPAGALTTRLADLRVTLEYRRAGRQWARFIVDRFSADHLWEWLLARLGGAERE